MIIAEVIVQMSAKARASITVDDKVVMFEGPQEFVDAQVAKYIGGRSSSNSNANSNVAIEPADLKAQPILTEKQLVQVKQPKGHAEKVAVLAFALAESGHPEFTEKDMRRAYIRASVKPPKVVGQAIRDAKNLFEYVEGAKKWGSYKLSDHGDRTVRFDLPRKKEGA